MLIKGKGGGTGKGQEGQCGKVYKRDGRRGGEEEKRGRMRKEND